MKAARAAMRAFGKKLPSTPLVALLETAFFDTLADAALTYSVPYEWKEQFGIRRYGFHGASHRAASEYVQRLTGRQLIKGLRHRGGLRAQILSQGAIRVGDSLSS